MAWDYNYVLPAINSDFYKHAERDNTLLDVSFNQSNMPIRTILPGRKMRIRMLAPPGTVYAAVSGESNNWQGGAGNSQLDKPVVGGFDYDPGSYRTNPIQRPDGGGNGGLLYFSDLEGVTAALNKPVYGNGSPMYTMLDEARYVYFVLYNPTGSVVFTMGTLRIVLLVRDADLYNAWRSQRPWAGGTSSDEDGINDISLTDETKSITPSTTAFTLGHPARKHTSTEFGASVMVNGMTQAAGTTIAAGSSLAIAHNITPDSRDNGISANVVAIIAWMDADQYKDLLNAVWQQCVGGVWRDWVGPNVLADGTIIVPNISPYFANRPIRQETLTLGLGQLNPPANVSANGRIMNLMVGYQAVAGGSGQQYTVLRLPSAFFVS